MKVTIIRLKLSHLWNNEYCMFVSQIVAIVLKYNPEVLHLKKAFERVTAFMPELAKIKAQEQGNAISNQLADLNGGDADPAGEHFGGDDEFHHQND